MTKANLVACPRQVSTCLLPSNLVQTIGNTPLIPLPSAAQTTGPAWSREEPPGPPEDLVGHG